MQVNGTRLEVTLTGLVRPLPPLATLSAFVALASNLSRASHVVIVVVYSVDGGRPVGSVAGSLHDDGHHHQSCRRLHRARSGLSLHSPSLLCSVRLILLPHQNGKLTSSVAMRYGCVVWERGGVSSRHRTRRREAAIAANVSHVATLGNGGQGAIYTATGATRCSTSDRRSRFLAAGTAAYANQQTLFDAQFNSASFVDSTTS